MIPTGSMAPTLMGRHKEVTCPQCGLVYPINASDDAEQLIVQKRENVGRRLEEVKAAPSSARPGRGAKSERRPHRRPKPDGGGGRPLGAHSPRRPGRPQAHRQPDPGPRAAPRGRPLRQLPGAGGRRRGAQLQGRPHPGDEVPLRAAVPARLERPRSVGRRRLPLPREARDQLHQAAGRPARRGTPDRSRRPPRPPRARFHRLRSRSSASRSSTSGRCRCSSTTTPTAPRRSTTRPNGGDGIPPERVEGRIGRGVRGRGRRSETTAGPNSAIATSCPTPSSGPRFEKDAPSPFAAPRPTLITDFYAYNTNNGVSSSPDSVRTNHDGWLQSNWVGDLTVSGRFALEAAQPGGMLKLELVESGVSNRCEVDLISGIASIYHDATRRSASRAPSSEGDRRPRRRVRQRRRPALAAGRRPALVPRRPAL